MVWTGSQKRSVRYGPASSGLAHPATTGRPHHLNNVGLAALGHSFELRNAETPCEQEQKGTDDDQRDETEAEVGGHRK